MNGFRAYRDFLLSCHSVRYENEERRKTEMKFRPIGIISEKGKLPYGMKPSDFSDRLYDGLQLRKTGNVLPVVIMKCKRNDPLPWKVVYGFSSVFFRDFASAVAFCNSRGMEIMKEQVEE